MADQLQVARRIFAEFEQAIVQRGEGLRLTVRNALNEIEEWSKREHADEVT